MGTVVAVFGWRYGYFVPAMVGVVTAVGTYWLVQDRPRTMGLPTVNEWKQDLYQEKPRTDIKSVLGLQLSILRIPAIWVLCLSAATIYVTRYAINSWGILYLQEDRGLSLPMAGTVLMTSTVAGIAGAIAYGFISDKWFNARRPPANLLFGVLEIAGLCLFFFGPNTMPVLITGMVLFGLGLTGLVTALGGLFAVDIAPKRVAGAAMGVIGIFSYIGAGIQEYVSGKLIQEGMTLVGDVRTYDFGPVIWFWGGASVLSMLVAASLWNTKLRD